MYAVVELGTGIMAIGEFHLCYALAALLTALLLRDHPLGPAQCSLLLFSSLIFSRTYTATLYLAPALFALAVLRLYVLPRERAIRWPEVSTLFASIAIFAGSAALSLWDFLFPRDPASEANATDIWFPLTHDRQFQLGGLATVMLLIGLLAGSHRILRLTSVAVAVALGAAIAFPTLQSEPWMHYSARTIIGLFEFLTIAVIGISQAMRWLVDRQPSAERSDRHSLVWLPGTVLLLTSAIVLGSQTILFHSWLAQVECSVEANSGILAMSQAGLNPDLTRLFPVEGVVGV